MLRYLKANFERKGAKTNKKFATITEDADSGNCDPDLSNWKCNLQFVLIKLV